MQFYETAVSLLPVRNKWLTERQEPEFSGRANCIVKQQIVRKAAGLSWVLVGSGKKMLINRK